MSDARKIVTVHSANGNKVLVEVDEQTTVADVLKLKSMSNAALILAVVNGSYRRLNVQDVLMNQGTDQFKTKDWAGAVSLKEAETCERNTQEIIQLMKQLATSVGFKVEHQD